VSNSATIAALALGCLLAPTARADVVTAKYAVKFLGVTVGELTSTTALGKAGYSASLDTRVVGLASIASSFTMHMESSGSLRKGLPLPASFGATETNSGELQTMQVRFKAGSVENFEVAPPMKDAAERVPVLEVHRRNVVDPVSAMVMSAEPSDPSAACDRTLHLYDGISRSDLALSFVRGQEVKTAGYAGPVSVCAVRYIPIAGHKDSAQTRFMSANREIEIWLAPVPQSATVVLVGASSPLQLGSVRLDLEQLDIRADDPPRPADLQPIVPTRRERSLDR
jgi:hypothetical protein